MRAFNPFMAQAESEEAPSVQSAKVPEAESDDLSTMRDQIAEMQRKLDTLDR